MSLQWNSILYTRSKCAQRAGMRREQVCTGSRRAQVCAGSRCALRAGIHACVFLKEQWSKGQQKSRKDYCAQAMVMQLHTASFPKLFCKSTLAQQ
eukprot:1149577-Pelagomonas_calceolata.AAC.11